MLVNFLSWKYIIVLFTLATKDRSPNTHSAGTLSDYLLVDIIKYKLTNHPRYMDLMLQCWRITIPNAHLRFILSVFTLRFLLCFSVERYTQKFLENPKLHLLDGEIAVQEIDFN